MKKLKLTAVLFVCAFAFTACKKERTCKCVTTIDGEDPQTTSASLGKGKKSDQESACEKLNSDMNGMKTTCTLED